MSVIEAQHISKTYEVDHRLLKVLDDVSLKVAAGEFLVIAGTSGSGGTAQAAKQ